jgi:3-oxoacyl-[acyl-carrier-protein] synthase-3
MDVAAAIIESGRVRHALVVGVDCLSKQVDWTDRSTCVLFGDAAGAVVVEGQENTDRGLIETATFSNGAGALHIAIEVGGSKYPFGSPQAEGKKACITMNGREVYRFAVKAMGDACERVLEKAGMTTDNVDLFVPHQANRRIIDATARKLNIDPAHVVVTVEKHGNTSAASIPLALSTACQDGRIKRGDLVLLEAMGGGFTWGAALVRW